MWTEAMLWIQTQQRLFHDELTGALSTLADGGGQQTAWALILASFLYGVLHAAGPGHGKVILTTYLTTHRETLRRGIGLAAASAACQGATAIVLVYGLVTVAGLLPRDASRAADWSERASFALVILIGALLSLRALRRMVPPLRPTGPHAHGHDCGCGHAHAPSAEQVAHSGDLKSMAGVVLSIGLRPCTGALLMLAFANATGLAWAGVASVAAMSAGTAIAVAALALLAVTARGWVGRMVGREGGGWSLPLDGLALGGGLLLVVVGWSLLSASFGPVHPLGL